MIHVPTVILDASIGVFDDRAAASRMLGLVLMAVSDSALELSVHQHVDGHVVESETVASAKEYVAEKLRREKARSRFPRFKAAFPKMSSASPPDLQAFCDLAYASIAAEVYTNRWEPMTLFSSVDAGEWAEYQLPEPEYRRVLAAIPSEFWPVGWPTA